MDRVTVERTRASAREGRRQGGRKAPAGDRRVTGAPKEERTGHDLASGSGRLRAWRQQGRPAGTTSRADTGELYCLGRLTDGQNLSSAVGGGHTTRGESEHVRHCVGMRSTRDAHETILALRHARMGNHDPELSIDPTVVRRTLPPASNALTAGLDCAQREPAATDSEATCG